MDQRAAQCRRAAHGGRRGARGHGRVVAEREWRHRGAAGAAVVEARVSRRRVGVPRWPDRPRRLRRATRRPPRGGAARARRGKRRKKPVSTSTPRGSSTFRTGRRPRSHRSGSRRGSSPVRSQGGTEVADGSETDAVQWFTPEDALAARAVGEIELAPPQYVTLLDLRAVLERRRGAVRNRGRDTRRLLAAFSFRRRRRRRCASTATTWRTPTSVCSTRPAPSTVSSCKTATGSTCGHVLSVTCWVGA